MNADDLNIPQADLGAVAPTAEISRTRLGAAEELARIRHEIPRLFHDLSHQMKTGSDKFPLLHFGETNKVSRLSTEVAGDPEQWFFIGDIHGDFFALHTLLHHAEATRPDCKILFLGDMVDRGDRPFECIFLLLEWGLQHPGRLAWIAGNHDVAFDLPPPGNTFTSQVKPSELLEVINGSGTNDVLQGYLRMFGRFVIDLGNRLPRALLFPDGLLATHGGIPLSDLHAEGAATESEDAYLGWLNSEPCLKDFTWTRIHRAPKKMPDRYSTGAEYGFKDFEAFCALKPQWFAVQRMITGHQHPADGFTLHASYKVNPALTLVGFGFEDQRPMPAAYQLYKEALHIAQGLVGQLPAVTLVPVDRRELTWMYPPPEPLPQAATAPTAAEGAAATLQETT
jgi:hypothetical protein